MPDLQDNRASGGRRVDLRVLGSALSLGVVCLLAALNPGSTVKGFAIELPGPKTALGRITLGLVGGALVISSVVLWLWQTRPFDVSVSSPEQELRNRHRMLERVRTYWVRGVLEQSLDRVARMELGLERRTDVIAAPWRLAAQQPNQRGSMVPTGTSITQLFDEMDAALLILGAPGAGKTTLLLELTRDLLNRAEQDLAQPLPVVFNLASWARQRSLEAWLVDELRERYDVPVALARRWVQAEQVAPLLDGLDEVKEEYRNGCLEAINTFRQKHGFLPLAVCSRTADYLGLAAELRVHSAVEIQPLSRRHISEYLRQAGKPLAGVRAALRDDPDLWELLESPLHLSIVALAYRDKSAAAVRASGTLAERRTHLFGAYTDEMFRRRAGTGSYPRHKAIHWLQCLARSMQQHNQSVFYVEWMQPSWLTSKWRQRTVVYGPSFALSLVAVALVWWPTTMSGSWVSPAEKAAYFVGQFTIIGLPLWLAAYGREIRPMEKLRWSWTTLRRSIRKRLITGVVLFVLLTILLFLVSMITGDYMSSSESLIQSIQAAGIVAGAITIGAWLLGGVTSQLSPTRTTINHGIQRSARNAVMLGLIVFLGVAIPVVSLVETYVPAWLGLGLGVATILGLQVGGRAYLQHLVLRSQLALEGHSPWTFIRFLNYSVDHLFLRRVGGGFIFTHRLLLEYVADLELQLAATDAPSVAARSEI
jgi:hypothetical protein